MNIQLDGDRVIFLAEDGRRMFGVRMGPDGRSIEVRGLDVCHIGGVMYTEQLTVEPYSSNALTIRTIPWTKKG